MERSLILSPSNHSGNCGRVSRDNSRIKFDRHFLVTGSWSARARVGAPLVKGDVNIYAVLQRNHAIYHSLKLLSEVIKALASATPRRVKLITTTSTAFASSKTTRATDHSTRSPYSPRRRIDCPSPGLKRKQEHPHQKLLGTPPRIDLLRPEVVRVLLALCRNRT